MAAPASSHEDLVPYDDSDVEADKVNDWPARHALAAVWEESFTIRQALRKNGKMLKWSKVELTGIANLQALRDNREAIADALTVWASHSTAEAKSPPVSWLKDEAFDWQKALGTQKKSCFEKSFLVTLFSNTLDNKKIMQDHPNTATFG